MPISMALFKCSVIFFATKFCQCTTQWMVITCGMDIVKKAVNPRYFPIIPEAPSVAQAILFFLGIITSLRNPSRSRVKNTVAT